MSKQRKSPPQLDKRTAPPAAASRRAKLPIVIALVCLLTAIAIMRLTNRRPPNTPAERNAPGKISQPANAAPPTAATASAPVSAPSPSATPLTNSAATLPTLEINHAVMVTQELDFGPQVPTIAEALKEIERRHQPADGVGRVFAILDAYGEPTPDGKKLHISMHVSTEKPGLGTLVFRRTGEVLWQSRVVLGTNANVFTGKNLTIMLDDGQGRTFMVDGSGNPATILDARVRDSGMWVRDFWPDNAEREVTFIYSACGCPVKAMVRRLGERTTRTKDLPVMFPDDPPALSVIARLMAW